MREDTKTPETESRTLSIKQLKAFHKGEPKTLGAIQIIIGMLTLCMTIILFLQDVEFKKHIKVLAGAAFLIALSGAQLVHAGRKPSFSAVKFSITLHFLTAVATVAGFGLLSKYTPYPQGNREKEFKIFVNGIMGTMIMFLVLEFLISVTSLVYGINTLLTEDPEQVDEMVQPGSRGSNLEQGNGAAEPQEAADTKGVSGSEDELPKVETQW